MLTNWRTFKTIVAWRWRLVMMAASDEASVDAVAGVEGVEEDDSSPLATATFLSRSAMVDCSSSRSFRGACTRQRASVALASAVLGSLTRDSRRCQTSQSSSGDAQWKGEATRASGGPVQATAREGGGALVGRQPEEVVACPRGTAARGRWLGCGSALGVGGGQGGGGGALGLGQWPGGVQQSIWLRKRKKTDYHVKGEVIPLEIVAFHVLHISSKGGNPRP
jgi:hypothetical protein